MAGSSTTKYAGEDRGYGKPKTGKPGATSGAGKLMNQTPPGGGRVANGAKEPHGSAYPTQDSKPDAYQGGKVIRGKK